MARTYGKTTKFVRHFDEGTHTIEPQRFKVLPFWATNTGATSRTDGLDLTDDNWCPLGSQITKHKVDVLITPETIEPQQIYMGRIKLSYHDIYARPICGGMFDQASYQDTTTEDFDVDSNAITPHLYPDADAKGVLGYNQDNQEIGGSSSGYGIQELLMDDEIHHFLRLKKVTVFDQRPVMGERWQRVPSKVKRCNPFTFYGLFIFNDSPRGATPADTQIKVNLKSYFEEWAL